MGDGVLPLRPLSPGEILDGAFAVMRWNPGAVFGPSAIVGAISGVVSAVVTYLAFSGFTLSDVSARVGSAAVGSGAGMLVSLVLSAGLTGMVAAAVGRGMFGRRETAAEVWRAVRPRIWALLAAVLLGSVAVAVIWLGVIAVAVAAGTAVAAGGQGGAGVLAGIGIGLVGTALAAFFWIRLSLALPAVMLENAGPLRGLRRSWRLVRRGWWRVFGITLLTAITVAVVNALISAPFDIAGNLVSGALGESGGPALVPTIIVSIGVVIALAATTPVTSCVIVLLYTDMRMRREGMDIAARAGLAPPGQYPAPPGAPVAGAQPPVGPFPAGAAPAGAAPAGPVPGAW
jgi:hypothetical protein